MQFIYPAVFRKTASGYAGVFPDLEGCAASADTIDEVVEEAHLACESWILTELEEDLPFLPAASDPEDLSLQEEEFVRRICVNIRLTDGWDE